MRRVDGCRVGQFQARIKLGAIETEYRGGREARALDAAESFSMWKNLARWIHPLSRNRVRIEGASWSVFGGVQRAECPCADAEGKPKCDGAIGKRDDDGLTPIHVERSQRNGHQTFHDADA